MDDIREDAIVQQDFGFMSVITYREEPGFGNLFDSPQADRIERYFDLGATPSEEALDQVIAFAQNDGWSPNPDSQGTPSSQLKPLRGGPDMRLIVWSVDDRLYMTIEAPF